MPADEDRCHSGLHVAFGAAAEQEFAGAEGKELALRFALQDLDAQIHAESFRRELADPSGRIEKKYTR